MTDTNQSDKSKLPFLTSLEFKSSFLQYKKWDNIPQFAVLIGKNGSGKSQILQEMFKHSQEHNTHSIVIKNKSPGSCELEVEVNINWKRFAQDFVYIHLTNKAKKCTDYADYTALYTIDDVINDLVTDNTAYKDSADKTLDFKALLGTIQGYKKEAPNEINPKLKELEDTILNNTSLHNEIKNCITKSILLNKIDNTRAEDLKAFNQEIINLLHKGATKQLTTIRNSYDDGIYKKINVDIKKIFKEFQIELSFDNNYIKNLNNNTILTFDQLSTGEKLLIQLASMYYLIKTSQPPMYYNILFLLDEVDAFLHHNFCKNIIDMFNNIHQESSLKSQIILTTHNYSTIANAPQDSLFYVNEGNIEPIDKDLAILQITDGDLDLSKTLKPYNLFVEGQTDVIIIKNAIDKLKCSKALENLKHSKALENLAIISAGSHTSIWHYINSYNQQQPDNLYIGLYDCDAGGLGSFKKTEETIDKLKLFNCKVMHLSVKNTEEQKKFKEKKNLCIESMFFLNKLKSYISNTATFDDLRENKEYENSPVIYSTYGIDKPPFAESTADFTEDDFANFKPLLDEIVNHIEKFDEFKKSKQSKESQ